ncbi:NtaA/DmoA family FMN-dependent monooxygenase [Streptomyces sp. NPDC006658]|uniref:NtaA/DmoA family FMN-dependent monooxygenase n=1 Tax=Streptomyces sp. NPDC006658 TaxID=3156900 RepID=UPI0033F9641B
MATVDAPARELHLNVNILGGLGLHPGAWRWPAADPLSFLDVDSYVRAARTAERGLLDAVFLADSPGIVQNVADVPPYNGIEPTLLLTAIARETTHIGLIGTASTTYNEPYNIARRFLGLDVLSGGRVAWNAVTTYNAHSARNFGAGEPTRAQRYARGNEFVHVVRELWQGWRSDAVLADRTTGRFADPDRIRPLRHEGAHFTVHGPLTLPGSPQGYPVIFQAGGGVEGRELAARFADAVFAAPEDLAAAGAATAQLRAQAAAFGRDPQAIRVLPGLRTTVGGTEEEAWRRRDQLADLSDRSGELVTLAGRLGVPSTALDLDSPVPARLLRAAPPAGGGEAEERARRLAERGLTVRDLLSRGLGAGYFHVVGTPEQVADRIQLWFESRAVDGFNLMPDVLADGLPALVDEVVPVLRRRGLFRTEYRGSTLRAHYGLPLPGRHPATATTG